MEWRELLNLERFMNETYSAQKNRPIYEQDADRITFSAPFRRLANKTQVHPLYENDHIHHRLIHSVETASLGRSLGLEVGSRLEEQGKIKLREKDIIVGLLQGACLAHDIGNPPFGHSGETAIANWFSEKFAEKRPILDDLSPEQKAEFESFEGNAQGFRILTRLEMRRNEGGMQLSHALLGTFMKYPTTAWVKNQEAETRYPGLKKYGIFTSELAYFEKVAEKLALPFEVTRGGKWWRRHPLVYLVEAADDICYNVIDVEDAFTAGDLSFPKVESLLCSFLDDIPVRKPTQSKQEYISELRARAIGLAIKKCAEAFIKNSDEIMRGVFSSPLIEASKFARQFGEIKDLSDNLYKTPRKTELEIRGRNAIFRTLEGLYAVVQALAAKNWDISKLEPYHQQVARAFGLDLRDVSDNYLALHAMTDCVSGMTDRFTIKASEMLA